MVVAGIDPLLAQLKKPEPSKPIIGMLWGTVEIIVTAAGLVDVAANANTLIGPLLS